MHNSGLLSVVSKAAWLLTALAAVAVGLAALGYNVHEADFFVTRPSLVMALRYVLLVAGVFSLVMFGMACTSGCCCSCGSAPRS